MVFENLATVFSGFFIFLKDIIFIVYALILMGLFFGIQALFIWFYYQFFKHIGAIGKWFYGWFTFNEDKIKGLFNYK